MLTADLDWTRQASATTAFRRLLLQVSDLTCSDLEVRWVDCLWWCSFIEGFLARSALSDQTFGELAQLVVNTK